MTLQTILDPERAALARTRLARYDNIELLEGDAYEVLRGRGPFPEGREPLRLERARYLQSVCVLMNAEGQYHLERHTPQKVRVFEGSLRADELRGVVHILSGDLLFKLEQKQVPDLMLKADDEAPSAPNKFAEFQEMIRF